MFQKLYSNNPAYELKHTYDRFRFYIPVNTMEGYSAQRYLEAINQNIYSASGATKDVIEQVMNIILERCNNEKLVTTLRTDVAALAQSVLYRTKHPVDIHCGVRMGAILCFMEEDTPEGTISEPVDKIERVFLDKKVNLAFASQENYDFFLGWGIVNTPIYKDHLDTLSDLEYSTRRAETVRQILPESLIKQFNN